jgi:hypothetical protein
MESVTGTCGRYERITMAATNFMIPLSINISAYFLVASNRRYQIKEFLTNLQSMPLTKEFRLFFLTGQVIQIFNY